MSRVAEFCGVTKQFSADVEIASRQALVDMFIPARWRRSPRKARFFALRDASFALDAGEAVAMLGEAGAGKSTVARLLGGVLAPDVGTVSVSGRCVFIAHGTAGFKPMLTVQENLLFKSALLGMSRKDAFARKEAILQFANLEDLEQKKLFDIPTEFAVKLGQAICLHADADLYVFDGKVVVGDEEFRERCLQRILLLMQKATVFFLVSKPQLIEFPLTRVLILQAGRIVYDGPVADGYAYYEQIRAEMKASTVAQTQTSPPVDYEAENLLLNNEEVLDDADLSEASEEEQIVLSTEALDNKRSLWKSLDAETYTRSMDRLDRPGDIDPSIFETLTPEQRYVNSRHFAGKSCLILQTLFNGHNIALRDLIPLVSYERAVEVVFRCTPKKVCEIFSSVACEIFEFSHRTVRKQFVFSPPLGRLIFKQGEVYSIVMRMMQCRLAPGQYALQMKFLGGDGRQEKDETYKLISFTVVGRTDAYVLHTEENSPVEWDLSVTPLRERLDTVGEQGCAL